MCFTFFFFNDTATTEIYTLSLHDALPISLAPSVEDAAEDARLVGREGLPLCRSEEHTSELQSLAYLVCRLLLEKKKKLLLKRVSCYAHASQIDSRNVDVRQRSMRGSMRSS